MAEDQALSGQSWPVEIRLKSDHRTLAVTYDDGAAFEIPAEMLRVMSPSAEVQGHSPSERVTVGGKRNVAIRAVEPVGNYAVRLQFDDGHGSGIFTWGYLRRLGADREALWSAYLAELASKGLSRDR
jgi:DUF971 family protein